MELGWRYPGVSAMGKTAILRHKEAGVNILLVPGKGDNSVSALQRYSTKYTIPKVKGQLVSQIGRWIVPTRNLRRRNSPSINLVSY